MTRILETIQLVLTTLARKPWNKRLKILRSKTTSTTTMKISAAIVALCAATASAFSVTMSTGYLSNLGKSGGLTSFAPVSGASSYGASTPSYSYAPVSFLHIDQSSVSIKRICNLTFVFVCTCPQRRLHQPCTLPQLPAQSPTRASLPIFLLPIPSTTLVD